MKMSLLDMTQNILSALNSDEVNSIGDTPESLQVAQCIRTTYLNMLGKYEFPENVGPINLIPSNNEAQPTLMTLPSGTARVEWIKYFNTNPAYGNQLQEDQFGAYSTHDVNTDLQNNANGWIVTSISTVTIGSGTQTFTIAAGQTAIQPESTAYVTDSTGYNTMTGTVFSYSGTTLVLSITSTTGSGTYSNWTISQNTSTQYGPGYQEVHIISMQEFFHMNSRFNMSEGNVGNFILEIPNQATGVNDIFTIFYENDKPPRFCTIIRNHYLLFDSFDNTQDSTLQNSKIMCQAWIDPDFQMVDTFIPFMDDKHFPLLLNDAKALAFTEIKNQPHPKAERETDKQLFSLMKWKAQHDTPSYFEELPGFGRVGSGGWGYRGRHV